MHVKLVLVALLFSALIKRSSETKYSIKLEKTNEYCNAKDIPEQDSFKKVKTDLTFEKIQSLSSKTLLENIGIDFAKNAETMDYAKAILEVAVGFGISVATPVVPLLGLFALIMGTLADYKNAKETNEKLVVQINEAFSKLTNDMNKKFENVQGDITESAQQLERSILIGELKQMFSLLTECRSEEKFAEDCYRNAKRYIESAFYKLTIYYDEVVDGKKLEWRQLQRLENNMDLFTIYIMSLYFPSRFLQEITSGDWVKWEEKDIDLEKIEKNDLTSTQLKIFKYVNDAGWKVAGSHKKNTERDSNKLTKEKVTVEGFDSDKTNEALFYPSKGKKTRTYKCKAKFDAVLNEECVATFKVNLATNENLGKTVQGDTWKALCFEDMESMYTKYHEEISGEIKKRWRQGYLTPLVNFMKTFNNNEVKKKAKKNKN